MYSFGWGHNGEEGSSDEPNNVFFRGPAPFSEPETAAVRVSSYTTTLVFCRRYFAHIKQVSSLDCIKTILYTIYLGSFSVDRWDNRNITHCSMVSCKTLFDSILIYRNPIK